MNIHVLGFRHPQLSITDRLIDGFKEIGHTCDEGVPADFVIATNHDEFPRAIKEYKDVFKIFTILDVPMHVFGAHQIREVVENLKKSDAITSISKTTAQDVKKYYGYNSEVVYTPMLPGIENKNKDRDMPFLYVGRIGDPNKRMDLILRAFTSNPKNEFNGLYVCGPEQPFFGSYLGVVNNEQLVEFYNRSFFLLLPSSREGVGLPMIEAALCGCIPITCRDNPTAKEFGLDEFSVDPVVAAIFHGIQQMEKIGLDLCRRRLAETCAREKLEEKFSAVNVARRYLDIYNR